jgi:hypothetical protein
MAAESDSVVSPKTGEDVWCVRCSGSSVESPARGGAGRGTWGGAAVAGTFEIYSDAGGRLRWLKPGDPAGALERPPGGARHLRA